MSYSQWIKKMKSLLEKSLKLTILPLQKGLLLIVRKIIEIDHYATPEGMAPPC